MSKPLLLSRRFHSSALKDKRVCICFGADLAPDAGVLRGAIDRHFDNYGIPEIMLFVGFRYNIAAVRNFSESKEFRELLPNHTDEVTGSFRRIFVAFEVNGAMAEDGGNHLQGNLLAFETELRRSVATYIFRHRGALLVAPSGFHFVKPSERHSLQFIRAGEALFSSEETFFLAAWLLRHIPARNERIYCDSASICSLGYALMELHWRFDRETATAVTIDSFGGYKGAKEFVFIDGGQTSYLISSSTSGGLNRLLTEKKKVDPKKILLICYVGTLPPAGTIFDITYDSTVNAEGFEPVDSFEPEHCSLCKENRKLIYILGDQFLPTAPRIETEFIHRSSAPIWLGPFLREFLGHEVCRVHHYDAATNRDVEVFLDLLPFLKTAKATSKFTASLRQKIHQNMPRSIGAFVVLSDPASVKFHRAICRSVPGTKLASVPCLSKAKLLGDPEGCKKRIGSGCIVVISSVAASGRNLLAVSQILRNLAKGDAIYYLVAVSRTASRDAMKDLCTDLTYGQLGRGTYRFDSLCEIYLPTYSSEQVSPWAREQNLLTKICSAQTGARLKVTEARIEAITQLRTGAKAKDIDIFLPSSATKTRLKIRPNFSLVDDDLAKRAFTQSEIFFVVTAILHQIRLKRDSDGSAHTSDFIQRVWSPRTFERFNDGVIQAAILRASAYGELDYSGSTDLSAMMRDTFINLVENRTNDIGEAAGEFLLATAIGKLRFTSSDLGEIKRFLARHRFTDELGNGLAEYIRQNL